MARKAFRGTVKMILAEQSESLVERCTDRRRVTKTVGPRRGTIVRLPQALVASMMLAVPLAWAAPAQQAYVKASNTGSGDWFGHKVAVSGDTMVVGALWEDSNATGVNGVGADPNRNFDSGAAYVYVRNGTNWVQQAYLKASNTEDTDGFGCAVAVSGDTVVIGARYEDSAATGVNGDQSDDSAETSGAAYVFVRTGTNWTQQAYLKASNTGILDQFGWSVAISGDTLVVGAFGEASAATGVNGDQYDDGAPRSGAAYVFVRTGTNWTQQAYLKASNTGPSDKEYDNDRFGWSVAVSGDTVVVGAQAEASSATGVNGNQYDDSTIDAGAVYVFTRTGTNWSQQAYLKASNTGPADRFGTSVSATDDTIVVGAPGEFSNATGVNGDQTDNSAQLAGAAYVFVRAGTNWSQQAYLKASNSGMFDEFGWSVAISGSTVAVGAYAESSNATGVNGEQSDNSLHSSGAAYVFVRRGTNWEQQAYLKASNTRTLDYFGWSVAASGDTVVVGAVGESSNATGVNGDQLNSAAGGSGAAYVFTGLGIGPQLALVADGSGGYLIRFVGAPDVTYELQRAPGIIGPWERLDTLTAPASGLLEFHDTRPFPGQAFYRTVQP